MIRSFSAFTEEIDDAELAVQEILDQLELEGKLLDSTVGILTCYSEFIDTGVTAVLRERLPFEIVGVTTNANGANGQIGESALTLLVLTSDTVTFTPVLTDEIAGREEAPLRAAYGRAMGARTDKPALILSFAPMVVSVAVDFYADAMDDISGGVPNYGMIATDHTAGFQSVQVIAGGKAYKNRCAFILIHGDIKPTFYLSHIKDEKIFPEKGVVTASQGSLLETVNDKPVADWLASLGLTQNEEGAIIGLNNFCFLMDYNDGTAPIVRVMLTFTVTTDKTYAVCAGDVPVGTTLSLVTLNADEVVASTKGTLDRILAGPKPSVVLTVSCLGRYFVQNFDATVEMEAITEKMNECGVPYFLAYSGGEICPVSGQDGALANRGHNQTFTACAF
ncbi:MAG: FIST C-terminal domain-containing protein [Oscillospiraceae bacterium]|nr:FIST C-terminal domain-containing protein [Oscillospiraceae bacterium]